MMPNSVLRFAAAAAFFAAASAFGESAVCDEDLALEETAPSVFSFNAYADVESAYVCRGFVWDSSPYSALFASGTANGGALGRLNAYVWTMSSLSGNGHSTPVRRAFNEVDYGIRYTFDAELAEGWTLSSWAGKQWATNPGVRHGGHSAIDWQAFQSLENPWLTPYWKLRYFRRPFQGSYWCAGAKRSFDLADKLSLTVDFFAEMGDGRNYRRLFGEKPGGGRSYSHNALTALTLMLRLDYAITDNLGIFGFVAQYDLVCRDAREAVGAMDCKEARRDLFYGGAGVSVSF